MKLFCKNFVNLGLMTLRTVVGAVSVILLIPGTFESFLGILGSLTFNTPPFDAKTYVDHERAPIKIENLIHLSPYTILMYNGILLLIGSVIGLISAVSTGILTNCFYIGSIATILTVDYFVEFSTYWNSESMSSLIGRMDSAMQRYGYSEEPEYEYDLSGAIFVRNSTYYWDSLQLSRDCCGLAGFDDWTRTPFYKIFNKTFPDSCCNVTKPGCGREFGWKTMGFGGGDIEVHERMKYRGCLSTFPESLTIEFHNYAVIMKFFGILMTSSACCSVLSLLLLIFRAATTSRITVIAKKPDQAINKLSYSDQDADVEGTTKTWNKSSEGSVDSSYWLNDPHDLELPWAAAAGLGDGDFADNFSLDLHKQSVATAVTSFMPKSTPNWAFQLRRFRSGLGGDSISNFLHTTSTTSFLQRMLQRRKSPTINSFEDTPASDYDTTSSLTSSNSLTSKQESRLYVNLDSCQETAAKGDQSIIPSLITLTRNVSPTIVFLNNTIDEYPHEARNFPQKLRIDDRKSTSSICNGKTLLRIGRPSQNRIHPYLGGGGTDDFTTTPTEMSTSSKSHDFEVEYSSMSRLDSSSIFTTATPTPWSRTFATNTPGSESFDTIYRRSDDFETGHLQRRISTPRLNSLEGLRISPADEGVTVILHPMCSDSGSSSCSSGSSTSGTSGKSWERSK